MTVCDVCMQLTMDSITTCNECRREREEFLKEYDEQESEDLMNSNNGNEKREFWIDPNEEYDEETGENYVGSVFNKHPGQGPLQWQSTLIHVISIDAYRELEKENTKLRKALEKYKGIAVCLEDGDNFVADEALETGV